MHNWWIGTSICRVFEGLRSRDISRAPQTSPRLVMDPDPIRQLSLSLFNRVKPSCLRISELAASPAAVQHDDLIFELRQLHLQLTEHKQLHSGEYVVSTKLADYIFFPLSGLLKQPHLPDDAVRYIVEIIAFLVENAWSQEILTVLSEQLATLVVFLATGQSLNKEAVVKTRDHAFLLAVARCLLALIKCAPRNYYTEGDLAKRLALLGDMTTILLAILDTLGSSSEPQIIAILEGLAWLYSTRTTAEQASFVFPGMVSKVINFYSKTKNLHTSSLIEILSFLKSLIVKVFGEEGLKVEMTDFSVHSFESLAQLVEKAHDDEGALEGLDLRVEVLASDKKHRTTSWRKATSAQLKISVFSFMKTLILNPGSKVRLQSNAKLVRAIFDFFADILRHCFTSLFLELTVGSLDILSALYHTLSAENSSFSDEDFFLELLNLFAYTPRSKLEKFLEQLYKKTDDLVSSQLSVCITTLNEEKIGLILSALKIHLRLLRQLQEDLFKPVQPTQDLIKSIADILSKELSKEAFLYKGRKKTAVKQAFLAENSEVSGNTLDDIELPPHINAKSLGVVASRKSATANNVSIINRIDFNLESRGGTSEPIFFSGFFTRSTERDLKVFLKFLGEFGYTQAMVTYLLETASAFDGSRLPDEMAISLWIANNILSMKSSSDSIMDEFLLLDSTHEILDTTDEDVNYLLLQSAQDVLDRSLEELENQQDPSKLHSIELSHAIALESFGILAGKLNSRDFQQNVLIDHLFPLLEALASDPNSMVHAQARFSLNQIVQRHYEGSLANLVELNADYLVNALSVRLGASSGLTPSLPAILLGVLRVSGENLLRQNQLQDILSQMFIVIDSFHGYSELVRNFFLVFDEVITKIKSLYSKELASFSLTTKTDVSQYAPWSILSTAQVIDLLNESNRQTDPFGEYDSSKEYFKRKPGMPFAEQTEDSDDEQDEIPEASEVEVWQSPLSRNTFTLVQQIFTYGLQLLSHPSTKLRLQLLATLKKCYPILVTHKSVAMPLLAQFWPLLLVLSVGSQTLSESSEEHEDSTPETLTLSTIEFIVVILEEDRYHERFMSSRFLDLWELLKKKVFHVSGSLIATKQISVSKTKITPALARAYSEMLVKGLTIYGKQVPDLTAHEMLKTCKLLGMPQEDLDQDIQNHIWVLNKFSGR